MWKNNGSILGGNELKRLILTLESSLKDLVKEILISKMLSKKYTPDGAIKPCREQKVLAQTVLHI